MNMAIVGSPSSVYYVEEYASQNEIKLEYFSDEMDITKLYHKLCEKAYNHIVINVEELMNEAVEVAKVAKKILQNTNANLVILASGYPAGSDMELRLRDAGVIHFCTAIQLGILKEQLQSALGQTKGEQKQIEDFLVQPESLELVPAEKMDFSATKIIAFAGALERIGTTTQALQCCKYLQGKGYKVAYLELNHTGFVNQVKQVYANLIQSGENGKITYQNLELYNNQKNIDKIIGSGYDFCVLDCGVAGLPAFNSVTYLNSFKKVMVIGSTPPEMIRSVEILKEYYESAIEYIFSFCPETEQDELLDLMEDKAGHTYFAGYLPDMFAYSTLSDSIYEQICKVEEPAPEMKKETGSKFGSIFKR